MEAKGPEVGHTTGFGRVGVGRVPSPATCPVLPGYVFEEVPETGGAETWLPICTKAALVPLDDTEPD